MKIIEIARSFSKTIQEKQFEPINIFASYKAEVSEGEDVEKMSKILFKKAVDDVGIAMTEKPWEMWTNPPKAARRITKGEKAVFETIDDSSPYFEEEGTGRHPFGD